MRRWFILAGYMLLTASTQLVWLSFAPITNEAARAMQVSANQVGWLAAIFAGVYLLLGLPAGGWIDRYFARSLALGAACNGLGALLRLASPHSFAVQLAGQLLLALGQPFVVNAMNALAQRYFPPAERPKAIAAGSASMFVGVLLASVSAPLLYGLGGLPLVLLVHALPAVLGALWVVLALRIPPDYPTPQSGMNTGIGLGWLRNRMLWQLSGLLFIGFGLFSALSTWLEALLAHSGLSATASGNLLGALVVGGIIGAATLTLPVLAAARGWRKELLAVALLATLLMLGVLGCVSAQLPLFAALGLGGFFLLSCLPIILEWAEERVGPTHQGAAVGFLMLVGNAGSLALMLLVGSVVERSALQALWILAAATIAGLLLLAALPKGIANIGNANKGAAAQSPDQ